MTVIQSSQIHEYSILWKHIGILWHNHITMTVISIICYAMSIALCTIYYYAVRPTTTYYYYYSYYYYYYYYY